MSRLIPIIYRNMKYPSHIEANIHEVTGNFYKEKLIIKHPYSLHTEPSAVPKTFNQKIINDFKHIKEAQKNNIPKLWYSEEWANEFFYYIDWLIGSNIPPEVLEIHPPFKDYCTINDFFDRFNVFYQKFISKYPKTTILIENRFGTRYKGGKFILSKCNEVLDFCELLKKSNIDLRIAIDYPQLFSSEVVKKRKKDESWMGENPLKLVEKIINFNKDLKKYCELICGFHMWGKLKKFYDPYGNLWTAHAGNLDTFFSNNKELKHMFLNSFFSTFNDNKLRYFVPEVHSGENDLHSIVYDMEQAGFKYISKN